MIKSKYILIESSILQKHWVGNMKHMLESLTIIGIVITVNIVPFTYGGCRFDPNAPLFQQQEVESTKLQVVIKWPASNILICQSQGVGFFFARRLWTEQQPGLADVQLDAWWTPLNTLGDPVNI